LLQLLAILMYYLYTAVARSFAPCRKSISSEFF